MAAGPASRVHKEWRMEKDDKSTSLLEVQEKTWIYSYI